MPDAQRSPTRQWAWSLAMLGLFNIVGSLSMGWAVGRWRMKSLLSMVYEYGHTVRHCAGCDCCLDPFAYS